MNTFAKKLIQSIRDGSLPIKVLNRFSKVDYVPRTEKTTSEIIAKIYPDATWKKLSTSAQSTWIKFHSIFETQEIQTVTWIGAHKGESAVSWNEAFPGRTFYLLEPVFETFRHLQQLVEPFPNLHALNVAAGAVESELEMHVDECSAASSLLPYNKEALKEWPFLGNTKKEKVAVKPLDKILSDLGVSGPDVLVVDTQGYEDAVFAGAKQALAKCKIVLVEMNVQKVYQNSSTFDSVYQTLRNAGFQLRHITHVHRGETNAVLQIDGVFIRE